MQRNEPANSTVPIYERRRRCRHRTAVEQVQTYALRLFLRNIETDLIITHYFVCSRFVRRALCAQRTLDKIAFGKKNALFVYVVVVVVVVRITLARTTTFTHSAAIFSVCVTCRTRSTFGGNRTQNAIELHAGWWYAPTTETFINSKHTYTMCCCHRQSAFEARATH